MNTFNTVVKFFVDCGAFLYPSLLMMALGLAIGIMAVLLSGEANEVAAAIAFLKNAAKGQAQWGDGLLI